MTDEEARFCHRLEEWLRVCGEALRNSDAEAARQALTHSISTCETDPHLAASAGYLSKLEQYAKACQCLADPDLAGAKDPLADRIQALIRSQLH